MRYQKLIFVNRFFYPDISATSQMLTEMATSLADRGYPVSIVTSRQLYGDPSADLEPTQIVGGVHVHRVATTRFGRRSLFGRAIDYATFSASASSTLFRILRSGDVVVAKTDPPMFSLFASPVARWRGGRSINWLQDIFPEVAEAAGFGEGWFSRRAIAALKRWRTSTLKSADFNIAIGNKMAAYLRGMGVSAASVRTIPNWADGTRIAPIPHAENLLRRSWQVDDKFVVSYSGNLGRAHDFQTFLDAIRIIETRCRDTSRQIVWQFVGGGALMDELQTLVASHNLTSVTFRPYVVKEMLAESLGAADVHLVSLSPQFEGLIVPSKYYGIAAAGRACIFIGDRDGEIPRILARTRSGLTVPQGNSDLLAKAIQNLAQDPTLTAQMGHNARQAFEREFDLQNAVDAWIEILTELDIRASGGDPGTS